ncbi:MAG TPA: glycosyltransferase, partial [Terriglobia bacterium]|nr:glycosyltransferase [Terriglobia bacterium]
MHVFWAALLCTVAILWIAESIEIATGLPSIPSLEDALPLKDSECPQVSILFAGRDEADKLPDALSTFLALDYPRYEVIAVDDRSIDGTRAILETAAQNDPRLKAVHVSALPGGWLGKPHALQQA